MTGNRHSEEMIKQTIEILKDEKVRITPQREAMIRYLVENENHPTAEMIFNDLKSSFTSMSLATVYNNLKLFNQLGIVKELNVGDEASHFDFAGDKHYHLICKNCGKIVDIYYPVLNEVESFAHKLTGFDIIGHHLEIYGICPSCQKKDGQAE
ncbi:hypothetical protein AWM75_05985 [Aerococcus urinaehominis]|uniref:Uncharacterized protein n=1 Tax=Aerococcus urinaehominis TaxID=128944 RepID=A0A0X8FM27_9LACT|nr:Fur family transcriptional regulator [Aerococcus urinaehominis]AMB99574.1 hypothetical protein AWM75_05985 [Aerococcus urinaehominis]SDM35649.1 Fur family transcriptional regulator, peroxide stress response regulator [Aerococcus urinaehominis]